MNTIITLCCFARSNGFNLAGNVVAFMPFGFFLPILWQKSGKLLYVTFWSFSFSLVVETIQLVYKVGTFDVDDLFLNTLGGIFGYMMMRLLFVGVRVGRHVLGYGK